MNIHPIIAPYKGLRYNFPGDLIGDLEMADCRNIHVDEGYVAKRTGYATKGNSLSGSVLGTHHFKDYQGNGWLLAITTSNAYKWDTTNEEWDRLFSSVEASTPYGYSTYGSGIYGGIGAGSYGGGAYGSGVYGDASTFSGNDDVLLSYTSIRKNTESNPWFVFTNGVDNVYVFKPNDDTQVEDLASVKARYVIEFKNHLFLLDTTESGTRNPQRARWSDTATPDDFTNGNASYNDLPGEDWIKGACKFASDYLVICKENSIWLCYATEDNDIFAFDQKVNGVGCAAGHTVKALPDRVFFLGSDDVYEFDGLDVRSIGTNVKDQLISNINPAQMDRCFAAIIKELKEYWLFVPYGDNTYPNVAWCYHYDSGGWTRHSYGDYLTAIGKYEQQSGQTFDDASGTMDSDTGQFDDRYSLRLNPTIIFGDKDGVIYETNFDSYNDNDTAIDGYFETRDFNFTDLARRQWNLRLDVSWLGSGMDVDYSLDKGANWTTASSLSSANTLSREKVSLRTHSDWIRFRFRNNSSSGWFKFNRGVLYWVPGGRI